MKTPQVNPLAGMTPLGLPETQHTLPKLALGIISHADCDTCQIIAEDGQHIATVEISPEIETAQAIVQACNSHKALIEALEQTVNTHNHKGPVFDQIRHQARQALTLAKGGE